LPQQYSTNFKRGADLPQKTSYVGNNTKSLTISVDASLKKLRTHYIDILYLHWWDYTTSIEEVMNSLHNLVVQGKVLYLGVSDTPAWIVAKANNYAKMSGKTQFVIYQGEWNIMQRDMERDIIPMCRQDGKFRVCSGMVACLMLNLNFEGLALAPWNVLASGKFRTDAEEERRRQTGEQGRQLMGPWERNEQERKVSHALEKVASELGAKHITSGMC
jgi:aryl-alcohol dehydrogenase-like predicted oxidoreductase